MRPYYPSNWTMNGERTFYNLDLSESDKEYVRYCYPSESDFHVDAIMVDSLEEGETTQEHHEEERPFNQRHTDSSAIVIRYNWVSFEPHSHIWSYVDMAESDRDEGSANIRVWSESPMYSVDMILFELGSKFPLIQYGKFGTGSVHGEDKPKTIAFLKPFSEPPNVLCFFTKLLSRNGEHPRHVSVTCTNITAEDFTVKFEGWIDIGADIVWVAHPAKSESYIASGESHAKFLRHPWKVENGELEEAVSSKIRFSNCFANVPRVLLGFRSFKYSGGNRLNPRASVSDVTKDVFDYHIGAWGDSHMYEAGVGYLAWED
ncbi:hypothetical protein AtubIFM55763_007282 [Aspergillus tubingensis]|nr:hypothetical protein AtubIFM54640_002604 [Aspergillus tubingensis]GLA75728.1 hypothetical protein AtubIFM55763_007282 [Aspergillus tubingensis]